VKRPAFDAMLRPRSSDDVPIDGVEEGKRLVRAAGGGTPSLAERVAERLRSFAWAPPLHGLRLNGRQPVRLVAVPIDPIPGDVARGKAMLAGQINYLGEARDLARLDLAKPDWTPGFDQYLHGFDWLRDLAMAGSLSQGVPVAEALMSRWLARHADKPADPAWSPALWGRRILFWTAHAPLILSSTDVVYRAQLLNTLARGARHLDRWADKAVAGTGRIAAWSGIIAAGLLIPGGEQRRAFGERGLARALASGTFGDGGVVSRGPADLLEAVMLLGMVRACYEARGLEPPELMRAALSRMVPALLGVMHGDRTLSCWQGGGPSTEAHVAAVIEASCIRTRPLRQSRDWGYQRLAAAGAVLIVDAAPPPIARLAAGGCASTLAFEFSDGPDRLVVNCGGARDHVVQLPGGLAEGLRTTAAHSTLTLADSNSTAILPDGTLGRGVTEVELSRQESEGASRIEASHDGYAARWGFLHRRQLLLTGDGRELRGEDALLPAGKRRPGADTAFTLRFHLGPGVEATPAAEGPAVMLRTANGAIWQFRCKGGTLSIDDSLWIDGQGRPVGIRQLVIVGQATGGGAHVSWVMKRAA